jgi:DNA-binding NtrC family response regulator
MSAPGRILLVEDREDWEKQITRYLRQGKYSYDVASDVVQAEGMLQDSKGWDVVVLDLRLKDWEEGNFEGMGLLPNIDALRRANGTQVIIVTAYPRSGNIREAWKDYEVADFFLKQDFDPDAFKQALRAAVKTAKEERDKILKPD